MKIFFLTFAFFYVTNNSYAQNLIGIFGGPQATTAHYTINGEKQKIEFKYGFQAGANMKIPFEGNLSFAPAAFYSLKGYKVKFTQFTTLPDLNAANNNTSIHTFELAALLQYDFSRSSSHFFVKLGPGLDFQLIGKEKYNLRTTGSVDRSMKFSNGDYGRYSANAIAQFGYEAANGFTIFGQYSYGLASISNDDFGPQIGHRVVGISVGKYLHKR